MTLLAFLRHGATAWSVEHRIQGRTDLPLSVAGRAQVRAWRLPATLAGARWRTSPLRRARETAALLGHPEAAVDPRLVETAWGTWEGRTIAELRAQDPVALAEQEARGLDFRPPGGEGRRQLRARVRAAVLDLRGEPRPAVLVCHKGVIHAALSLATGWNYLAKPPLRPEPDAAVTFTLQPDGRLSLGGLVRLRAEAV